MSPVNYLQNLWDVWSISSFDGGRGIDFAYANDPNSSPNYAAASLSLATKD